ncbi:MAG: hypothetical protein HOP15_12650 [Planctomycetes bacterium]|nr:hypothetical protein [Planctomycetota bacterium]
MRHALAALALAALGLACAPAGPGWTYTPPEVVEAGALFARLLPTKDGELVLANFWASW